MPKSKKPAQKPHDLINDARSILEAAIESVKPDNLIRQQIRVDGNILILPEKTIDLKAYKRVFVIGAGKASALMARELEQLLGEYITGGIVVVKDGHSVPCKKIKTLEAGHPVVDRRSVTAGNEILKLLDDTTDKDLIFCLISGGGSALLEKPPSGITLEDLQSVSRELLACGASIDEINTIRKHLSCIKGGQLAKAINPATCISFILSDVIGDPLDSIASGPTVSDSTYYFDAIEVLQKYRLADKLPSVIMEYLKRGSDGAIAETPKANDPIFSSVTNHILGNNSMALAAAKKHAEELGYSTRVLTDRMQGEARNVGWEISEMVKNIAVSSDIRPLCLLMGGETTVTLRGAGKGGRNQEFALSALITLKDFREDFVLLSSGTDGTDGPTDAAGAFASPDILEECERQKLDPVVYIRENDSYSFFEKTGGLVKTGPTGTNVMDIVIVLLGSRSAAPQSK